VPVATKKDPAKAASPAPVVELSSPHPIAVVLLILGAASVIAGLLGFGAGYFSTMISGILLGAGVLVMFVAGIKKLFGG